MKKLFFQSSVALKYTLAFLLFTALYSCGNGAQEGYPVSKPEVDFMIATSMTGEVDQKFPGIIEGSVNVDIKPQVSGYLEAIYVKEGDYVTKGQSLFKIKGDVFAEQVNSSQASYRSALANLSNAKLEVEKIKPLVEGKVFSEVQLKTAQANYEASQAQVAQAKAALGSSQLNANFSLIKAPVSGYISRIPNRIGNLVTPTDATPLTTLSDINTVFVYFSMSEADYLTFMKEEGAKQAVSLVLANGDVYEEKGTLEIASGNIDRTTGSIALKAIFKNPKKYLRSGGSARVILKSNLASVVSIPMASVKDIQDKFFVFTLGDSSKVAMTPIEIAGNTETAYFVKKGLKAGDKIAINSIDVLADGMEVTPNEAPEPKQ